LKRTAFTAAGPALLVLATAACVGRVPLRGSDAGAGDGGGGGGGGDGGNTSLDGGPAGATDAGPAGADAGPDAAPGTDAAPIDPLACPPVGPLDCSPGPGTGEADQCFSGTSCYITDVQGAVMDVLAAHPEWFDYMNVYMCPFILNVDGFLDSVVTDLVGRGLCAIRDPNAPGEEVTVKHDNAFTENFDLVASTGCARYGPLIYTGYCTPAWW
jgi:hypothetical protein